MTLTNATAVMTPKMRTQAPSSRRSVTRRTLLRLRDDRFRGSDQVHADLVDPLVVDRARLRAEGGQLRGRQRHDLHAVLLQLLVRRGGAVEPLPRAGLLPRRYLDRRLAHEVAVRRREAVPRELGDGDDDGDDGVLLPVHRALLEGLLGLAPVHVHGVRAERPEGVDEDRRADDADLEVLEVLGLADGALAVRDLAKAVLRPRERDHPLRLDQLEEPLPGLAGLDGGERL